MFDKEQVFIASDHAGFDLKSYVARHLPETQIHDLGPFSNDRCDYPDYARKLCEAMTSTSKGILICGSGIGISIMANRFPYIRAALCMTAEIAALARQHNDANVVCLGARFLTPELAQEIIRTFLTTNFEGGRHEARVSKLFYR